MGAEAAAASPAAHAARLRGRPPPPHKPIRARTREPQQRRVPVGRLGIPGSSLFSSPRGSRSSDAPGAAAPEAAGRRAAHPGRARGKTASACGARCGGQRRRSARARRRRRRRKEDRAARGDLLLRNAVSAGHARPRGCLRGSRTPSRFFALLTTGRARVVVRKEGSRTPRTAPVTIITASPPSRLAAPEHAARQVHGGIDLQRGAAENSPPVPLLNPASYSCRGTPSRPTAVFTRGALGTDCDNARRRDRRRDRPATATATAAAAHPTARPPTADARSCSRASLGASGPGPAFACTRRQGTSTSKPARNADPYATR